LFSIHPKFNKKRYGGKEMKIYFTGSLHNRDIDKKIYRRIISYLEKLGYTVKADHILFPTVDDLERQTLADRVNYYKKLDRWISESDLVVCEISYPSTLNIGHEISLALDKGKPVLALFQKNRDPGILVGISSEKLILVEYSGNDLEIILERELAEILKLPDTRFTLLLSGKIISHLNQIAKKRKSRSGYIRSLINQDMKKIKI